MRPLSTEQTVNRTAGGNGARVMGVSGPAAERTTPVATTLVATPGGYRDKKLIHHIEPGHRLDLGGGTVRKLHPEGNEVADFGAVDPHTPGRPLMPANVTPQAGMVPALAEGWISYAYWTNNTGHPDHPIRHHLGGAAGSGDQPQPDDLPVQRHPELDVHLPAGAAVGTVGAPAAARAGRSPAGTWTGRADRPFTPI